MPAGSRRRAIGLRREEVAVLAGLSPTWYAYLEQGRDIHPSAEVIDSLARVFGLTEDERRYMHTLADTAPISTPPLTADIPPEEIVRKLVRTVEHSRYPVYAVDLYCDLVAWNPAAAGYYTDFDQLPADRRNMLWWLLEAPEARQRLPEWNEEAHDVVARWRSMIATHGNDSRLSELITELQNFSPEFNHWWDAHDVREHRSRPRHFRHPQEGDRYMRLVVVQAPDFAPCVVVFHVPD